MTLQRRVRGYREIEECGIIYVVNGLAPFVPFNNKKVIPSMQAKKDIENRDDIAQLIRTFYTHVMQDDLIGFYFTEVAAINLEEHLPIMYNFWENLLFDTRNYYGGMMQKHFRLNAQVRMRKEHFERWLMLFEREVDSQFAGPKAEEAKERARTIAPYADENGSCVPPDDPSAVNDLASFRR